VPKLRGANWPVVFGRGSARRAGWRAPPGRLFVSRLTDNRLFDVRRDEMRLVRLVHFAQVTQAARHDAAHQAFAKIVRLFLVVWLMTHVMSPSQQTNCANGSATTSVWQWLRSQRQRR